MIRDKRGQSVIHHDRIKLCRDRAIPLWMRKMRQAFLSTGSASADPTNLLDGDSDLNLDILYTDQVSDAISSGGHDQDQTSDAVNINDSIINVPQTVDTGIVNPPQVSVSRRKRPVKLPRYLQDFYT